MVERVSQMIKVGDILTLETGKGETHEKYRCKVVEKQPNVIYIDYPINVKTERTVFLLDGTQLKATFVADDSTAYFFDCEILRRVKANIPMIALSYPGKENLLKIQRRRFVRIETSVDMAIHPMNGEFAPFITVTEDISAGGAAIVSDNKKLVPDTDVRTWLVLPMQNGETHYLTLTGKIIRSVDRQGLKPLLSIEFAEITPADRQLLLRFCFERQLALRKKGLE